MAQNYKEIDPGLQVELEKESEIRKYNAESAARKRRAHVRKARLSRLAEAENKWGTGFEIPTGNDPASRRERAKIAAIAGKRVPHGKPPVEKPRRSWDSTSLGPDISNKDISEEEYSSVQRELEIDQMWEEHEQEQLPDWRAEIVFAPGAQIKAESEGILIEKVDEHLDIYDVKGLTLSAESLAERELREGEQMDPIEAYEEIQTIIDLQN